MYFFRGGYQRGGGDSFRGRPGGFRNNNEREHFGGRGGGP